MFGQEDSETQQFAFYVKTLYRKSTYDLKKGLEILNQEFQNAYKMDKVWIKYPNMQNLPKPFEFYVCFIYGKKEVGIRMSQKRPSFVARAECFPAKHSAG